MFGIMVEDTANTGRAQHPGFSETRRFEAGGFAGCMRVNQTVTVHRDKIFPSFRAICEM